MQEEWRKIEGFDHYEVSSYGRVRSIDYDYIDSWGRHYHKKGVILKLQKNIEKSGYTQIMVTLRRDNKAFRLLVHRLVAKAFIPNPLHLPQINHIDEDSTNNCVNNLEWCTAEYNINYGNYLQRRSKTKSRSINVYDQDKNFLMNISSGVDASKMFNISRGSISTACHSGKSVKGLYFEFAV